MSEILGAMSGLTDLDQIQTMPISVGAIRLRAVPLHRRED